MRRGLLWMALLAAPGVQAAPACEEPVAVAQAFFKASVDDFLASPPALLTPAFARAMAGERECQRVEQGICRFDRDPWLDGQDGEIDAPPRFVARPSKAGAPVVVEARYPVWGQARVTRLILARAGQGCWQVDDLITNAGQSQRQWLSAPM